MSAPLDSGAMPLRPALRPEEDPMSPKSGPVKVVSIAEPEETQLSPEDPTRIKQFPASTASKRMTGRPQMPSNSSSRLSLVSSNSVEEQYLSSDTAGTPRSGHGEGGKHQHRHHHYHHHDKLLSQVAEWLQSEKAKRAARKSGRRTSKEHKPAAVKDEADGSTTSRPRTSSSASDDSAISLERLQRILEDNMSSFGHDKLPSTSPLLKPKRPPLQPGAMSPSLLARRSSQGRPRRRSSVKRLSSLVSSDTEYGQGGDGVVNSCDAVLDNSKTMSYGGGVAESSSETTTLYSSKREEKERKAWQSFKTEILKITHTLKLKRWRGIPLDCGVDLEVKRLSGALTNAVYVVSPPSSIPPEFADPTRTYKPPAKLLLRVYGPQVEHLIDRENELGILRRLARKKIGPRLLGTFENGRFEQYFESTTLTAEDLRIEATSKQIAKRMRELHEGIDLLDREVEGGPFVWLNWDKWVDRCEEVITHLDKQILGGKKGREPWRERGLVCGVEWPLFKATIDKYRKWLDHYYAPRGGVNRRLVFAHNDLQYGNILRITPERKLGEAPSPLLLPENTHRQLVVIDFEYASANTPGLEFANHFTEWCYNYHDTAKSWACNTDRYPTLEEQRRFIRSYVNHRPQFNPRASATPKLAAMDGLGKGNSISDFLLDSRNPGGIGCGNDYAEEERQREAEADRQVEELLKEVKIWRVANSAQWVAWGIVQAEVPGLDEKTVVDGAEKTEEPAVIEVNGYANPNVDPKENKRPEGLKAEALLQGDSVKETERMDDEEEAFDYLGYAQDRAMLFWGDVVSLGIVKKEELPGSLVQRMKLVEY